MHFEFIFSDISTKQKDAEMNVIYQFNCIHSFSTHFFFGFFLFGWLWILWAWRPLLNNINYNKKKLRALQPSSSGYDHRLLAPRRQPFPRVWSFCGSFVENVDSIAILCVCVCIYMNRKPVRPTPTFGCSTSTIWLIHNRIVTL